MPDFIRSAFSVLYLIVFLSFAQLSFGQSIKGEVVDKMTREPIAGAYITTMDRSNGVTSDVNGLFSISNVGDEQLEISFIGFKTIRVSPTTDYLIIELEKENISLEEVVLSAKSVARELRQTSMPVSVINVKDIQGTVSNVQEILAKSAGITIRSTGAVGSHSKISLRGLEGKRIGYFINSRSMSDNTDFLDINDIPIDLIERIEIYKGIVPGRLGGSAVGGAINIVTKDYPDRSIDLGYSLGSFNTHQASAIAKFNNADNSYEYGFGGFYTSADNDYEMELPLKKGVRVRRDHDRFSKILLGGGFATTKWYFDEIEIKPLFVQSKKEIQGIENRIAQAYSYIRMYALSLSTLEKQDFLIRGLDLSCSGIYTNSYFGLVDKAPKRQNWDGSFYPATTALGGEIGTNPNDAKNNKESLISRLNLDYALNQTSFINLNATYNYALGKPKDELKDRALGYKTNFNTVLHSGTANLTYTHRDKQDIWLNATTLKGYYYSVRSMVLPPNSVIKEPSVVSLDNTDVGINHSTRFFESLRLMLKFSGAYDLRLPTEEELIGDGFMIRPSGDLKPERSLSFNTGAYYDQRITDDRKLQVEVNVFYTHLKNMIRFTGNFLNAKYENFGEMRTYGVEMDVKYDVTPLLYVFTNATLQDLRDVQYHKPGSTVKSSTFRLRMPNIPYFFANAGCELHKENLFGGNEQRSKLFVTASFINEYFYDFQVSRLQERKIPTSLSFDAGIEHSWRNGNSSIGIQINNITNQKLITEFRRPLPGRVLSIKLRHIIH